MLQSLTSFGSAKIELKSTVLNIEIRTLNSSKGLDMNLKLPYSLREFENNIRQLIQNRLERGKIDIWINEEKNNTQNIKINTELVAYYLKTMKDIAAADNLSIDTALVLKEIFKYPDVVQKDDTGLVVEESDLMNGLNLAIDTAINFRLKEGKALQEDIELRISNIETLALAVEKFEKPRLLRIKERIKSALEGTSGAQFNEERLEQEMIYFIEKFDITEEKVRLTNHCKYFRELLQEKQSQGKKLGFLTQELGREINTIGSKANDFDLQKLVVQMKDELEKIKEQLSNIL
jgi:uncharacterized protein (TIGR00255 family)